MLQIGRLANELETQRLTLTKDATMEKEILLKSKEDEAEQLK